MYAANWRGKYVPEFGSLSLELRLNHVSWVEGSDCTQPIGAESTSLLGDHAEARLPLQEALVKPMRWKVRPSRIVQSHFKQIPFRQKIPDLPPRHVMIGSDIGRLEDGDGKVRTLWVGLYVPERSLALS